MNFMTIKGVSNMQHKLIINDDVVGNIVSYEQYHESWLFTIEGKSYQFAIPFENIKNFSFCGDLNIVTY